MRLVTRALLLFAGFTASVTAADIAGKWKVAFASGVEHKSIADAEFDFKGTPDFPLKVAALV